MEVDGTRTIPVDNDILWEVISDPETLTECIPGAEEIEQLSETKYQGTIKRGVAGINLSLDGEVEMIELAPPERMVAEMSGSDDKTGSKMTGEARMELVPDGDETALEYEVDIDVTGRLASVGARILKRKIKSDIGTYFDNVKETAEELDEQAT